MSHVGAANWTGVPYKSSKCWASYPSSPRKSAAFHIKMGKWQPYSPLLFIYFLTSPTSFSKGRCNPCNSLTISLGPNIRSAAVFATPQSWLIPHRLNCRAHTSSGLNHGRRAVNWRLQMAHSHWVDCRFHEFWTSWWTFPVPGSTKEVEGDQVS